MARTYTIDFVRWKYPYKRNRANYGKFTKTFNSLDEFAMFMYKTTNSDFRVAGAMSEYMNKKESVLFREKLYMLEQKGKVANGKVC